MKVTVVPSFIRSARGKAVTANIIFLQVGALTEEIAAGLGYVAAFPPGFRIN